MRFRLRTLLIVMTLAPPLVAGIGFFAYLVVDFLCHGFDPTVFDQTRTAPPLFETLRSSGKS
jgi:hypothetical protein